MFGTDKCYCCNTQINTGDLSLFLHCGHKLCHICSGGKSKLDKCFKCLNQSEKKEGTRFNSNIQFGNHANIFNKSFSQCYLCHEVVPHSQLFICLNSKCSHKWTLKNSNKIEEQFFIIFDQAVCGACTLQKIHKDHLDDTTSALKMAIKVTSNKIGNECNALFERVAELDHSQVFDYAFSTALSLPAPPVIPATKYLESSKSFVELENKNAELFNFAKKIENCRTECNQIVKEMTDKIAKEYLDFYDYVTKSIPISPSESLIELNKSKPKKVLERWESDKDSEQHYSETSYSNSTKSRKSSLNSVQPDQNAVEFYKSESQENMKENQLLEECCVFLNQTFTKKKLITNSDDIAMKHMVETWNSLKFSDSFRAKVATLYLETYNQPIMD